MSTTLRCVRWLLAFVCAGAIAAPAADDHVAPLQIPGSAAPTFTTYTPRDGLEDEVWSTVGVDRDGFVWAGSASGLARFDGYRWQMTPVPGARSLVRDMASDADGTLWAIFEREGLARYDGDGWQLVGQPRFHQRFSVVDGPRGRELWVSHNRGLATLVGGVWHEDPGNAGFAAGRAAAFARSQRLFGGPREWLGSGDRGLWYRTLATPGAAWRRFDAPELRDASITDLLVSEVGGVEELWVLTYGGGVARVRSDGVALWRSDSGELPTEAVYSIVETHADSGDRRLWIATRAGLLRIRGDDLQAFDRRHGLPSDAVRGVKVQRGAGGVESLWLATEGGLARATLADSPWRTVSLLGANENGVFGVLVEPDGDGGERLWVGSAQRGLALLQDGHWREFTQAGGELPARTVRGLWRLPGADGRDHRLLSMVGAPLLEIGDDLLVRPLPTPWPVQSDGTVMHALARTVSGEREWWLATSHAGVHRLRRGEWTAYPTLGEDRPSPVLQLAAQHDAEGRDWLWAADAHGLARFDGERWQRLDALPLPEDGFRSLLLVDDGRRQVLWAGSTHHGILRLDVTDPGRPQPVADDGLPAPPDPVIYSLLRDSRGRIYVCTNNGVQQLSPRPGGWDERVFRRRDGLVHDECNTNSQQVDTHDRYWVGTLGGLAMFDPAATATGAAPGPGTLHFTELRLDGVRGAMPATARLSIPAGTRELRIDYTLLTGARESETRYRTQLLGFEPAPVGWTREHGRVFATLPPGDYTLRVEARDYSGRAAEPRSLAIVVLSHWWQQRWLQGLAIIALLLVLAGVLRLRDSGQRLRQRELKQQVAARTADLADANQRLTELSYRDALTGIANRRRLLEATATAVARAVELQRPLGLIVADVDHFKDYNDAFGHLAGDAALRAIADAMDRAMREQDLVARFGGEEFACLMVDAEPAVVLQVAERMRALVEALPPRALGNDTRTLTISLGVVCRVPEPGATPEALLHAADVALYAAKAAGRNRVHVADGN